MAYIEPTEALEARNGGKRRSYPVLDSSSFIIVTALVGSYSQPPAVAGFARSRTADLASQAAGAGAQPGPGGLVPWAPLGNIANTSPPCHAAK